MVSPEAREETDPPRRIWWARPVIMGLLAISYMVPWLVLDDERYSGYGFGAFMAADAERTNAPGVAPITWHLVPLVPYAAAVVAGLEWRGAAEKLSDLLYFVALLVAPFALLMTLVEATTAGILPGAAAPIAVALAGVVVARLQKRRDTTSDSR